jgi:hypothetical protein
MRFKPPPAPPMKMGWEGFKSVMPLCNGYGQLVVGPGAMSERSNISINPGGCQLLQHSLLQTKLCRMHPIHLAYLNHCLDATNRFKFYLGLELTRKVFVFCLINNLLLFTIT